MHSYHRGVAVHSRPLPHTTRHSTGTIRGHTANTTRHVSNPQSPVKEHWILIHHQQQRCQPTKPNHARAIPAPRAQRPSPRTPNLGRQANSPVHVDNNILLATPFLHAL